MLTPKTTSPPVLADEPTVTSSVPQPFEVEQIVIAVDPFVKPETASAVPFKDCDATLGLELPVT